MKPYLPLGWLISNLYLSPYPALHPIMIHNPRSSRITAAAGTRLARASFPSTVIYLPRWKRFTVNWPSSLTQPCWIRLSPIVQYSLLLAHMSPDLVSVPAWPISLSGWLRIFDLVSYYPTNISNPRQAPPYSIFVLTGVTR